MKITNQTILHLDHMLVIMDDTGIKIVQANGWGQPTQVMIQKDDLRQIVDFVNGKKIIDEVTKQKPPDNPWAREFRGNI